MSDHKILKKQFHEITRVLGESVKAELDSEFGEGEVNFYWDNDDPAYLDEEDNKTILNLPAVNFYNPEVADIPELYSSLPVVGEIDEETLTAKEYAPYQYLNLDYAFRVVSSDPDVDLTLQMFFIRLKDSLMNIEPLRSEDVEDKAYVQLHWSPKPKTYNYDKRLLIRVFNVVAKVRFESTKYIRRRILSPAAPVVISGGEGFIEDTGVTATLTHTLSTGSNEVYVIRESSELPASGSIIFGRNNEEVKYSSRRLRTLFCDLPTRSYHFAGEQVTIKGDQ